MRLSKACGEFFVLVALSACFASIGGAQAPAAKPSKPAAKVKAKAMRKAGASRKSAAPKADGATRTGERLLEVVNKRDPFAPLINAGGERGPTNLPAGKAGLVIATVRVDGAVRSTMGMIAIVSNPSNSVYFIREGDRLYDGDVEKIGMDGVTFRESSRDAFGHAVERTVTKRIYSTAGEQQ